MNLFEIFSKKTDFEKNQEAIKKAKSDLIKTLKRKGFQDNEIEQVTQIIDNAQAQIQAIKDSLIGSNIITDKEVGKNPKEILENAEKRIDMITQNMQRAIPEKVQWIINNRFISE